MRTSSRTNGGDEHSTSTASLMSDNHPPHRNDGRPLRGTLLTDPTWLSDRITDTGRRWDCANARINATLWWYSASSTFIAHPIEALLTTRRAPAPHLHQLRFTLRGNGYLATTHSSGTVDGAERYSHALVGAYADIITPLAAISGAAPRALWAIASDSVANRALDAGTALNRIPDACTLAAALCRPPFIRPRFTTTPPTTSAETSRQPSGTPIIRRTSCCLIYQTTGGDKCTSCPRRPRQPVRSGRPAAT
ncbi:hypothetical protein BFL43_06010 [Williamsia sp. 1135]|nr:hypothetical protein BFL43_06010 [Williamsia sp. 1135]